MRAGSAIIVVGSAVRARGVRLARRLAAPARVHARRRRQTRRWCSTSRPNAIHAGIYSAIARTSTRDEGVHLHVVAPSASTDSIKLLETGRANFAILDIHDLAIARERGAGHRRDHGDRRAPAGRRDRGARDPQPRAARGPDRRRHRRAERHRRARLDRRRRRRRPGQASGRSRSASTPSPRCSPAGSRPRPRSGTTRA